MTVFCQKLLPSVNGEMIPAFEIMVLTPAIRNLIREGKVHQINGIIYTLPQKYDRHGQQHLTAL